jgi:hypothetical protein
LERRWPLTTNRPQVSTDSPWREHHSRGASVAIISCFWLLDGGQEPLIALFAGTLLIYPRCQSSWPAAFMDLAPAVTIKTFCRIL